MNRLLMCFMVLSVSRFCVLAEGPDEQYVRIYQVIQEADRLNESGQPKAAAAKYVEAQESLSRFRSIYPGWNERVVTYRLAYVATKLAPLTSALAGGSPKAITTNATTNFTAAAPAITNSLPAVANLSAANTSEFERQLKALQAEIERLQGDNRLLSAKLKEALSVQPAALDPGELAKAEKRILSLQKENELVKVQLAEKQNSPTPAPSPDLLARLAKQNDAIDILRAENEVLKRQDAEWRQKYESTAALLESTKAESSRGAERESTLRKIMADNSAMQKEVALWKQVAQSNERRAAAAPIPAMPPEAQQELLALRARVKTLEANPVPYTAEELALFRKPTASLVASVSPSVGKVPPAEGPVPKVSQGVPQGAGALVRAAERAFTQGNFAEAEQKYLEVLRQDQNNVTTLGNLASAQLQLDHIADSEKNVRRALELAPGDYFAQYLLGRVRFRQDRLDEALDALSRSVQANPDYADAQNYLGIVLSEKGQRGPAEAALRRAVQLQPDNAMAHSNLAIVYATQKPPSLALARWHYQKALAAGLSKNPELEKLLEQH